MAEALETSWAGTPETLQAGLRGLFTGKVEDTEKDLEKLFAPTFIMDADDMKCDFAGWVKHVRWLRENISADTINLTITHFMRQGNQIAERHFSTTLYKGVSAAAETFMWIELADDGRVAWIVEVVKKR